MPVQKTYSPWGGEAGVGLVSWRLKEKYHWGDHI